MTTANHRFTAYHRASVAWKAVGLARLGLMDAATAVTDAIAAGRSALRELDAFVVRREHALSAAAELIVALQAVVAVLPAVIEADDRVAVLAARGPLAGDPLPAILHVGAVRADAADQLTAAGFDLGVLVQQECAAIDVDAVRAVLTPPPRRLARAAAAAVLAAGLVASGGAAASAATTDAVTCAAGETELVAVANTQVRADNSSFPAWRVDLPAGDHACGTDFDSIYQLWSLRLADGREGVAYATTLIDPAYATDPTATTAPTAEPGPVVPTVTVTVTASPAETPVASAEPTAEPDTEVPEGFDWGALVADVLAFFNGVPVPVWIATAGGVLLVVLAATFLRRKKGDDTDAKDDDEEFDPAPAPHFEPMTRPRRPVSDEQSDEDGQL